MKYKWSIILFLSLGSIEYFVGMERLIERFEIETGIAVYLILLLFAMPTLLGWGTCKIYLFLERKIKPRTYIDTILFIFLIPGAISSFISIFKHLPPNALWNICMGLAFCIRGIYMMFFDVQTQEQMNQS